MKTFGLLKVTALAVFVSTGVQADPRRNESRTLDQDEREKYVIVTGSNLPQRVKVKSIGTDTPYNVRVITKSELMTTGRSTVAEGLSALDPSIRISGGR